MANAWGVGSFFGFLFLRHSSKSAIGSSDDQTDELVSNVVFEQVEFIHKYEQFTHRLARLRFQFLEEDLEVIQTVSTKLVDEEAEKAGHCLSELLHQFAATAGTLDGLARLSEYPFDLYILLIEISNDGDTGVRIVLQNSLGKQHHGDAFAAHLGVPDDPLFLMPHIFHSLLDPEILMDAGEFPFFRDTDISFRPETERSHGSA